MVGALLVNQPLNIRTFKVSSLCSINKAPTNVYLHEASFEFKHCDWHESELTELGFNIACSTFGCSAACSRSCKACFISVKY